MFEEEGYVLPALGTGSQNKYVPPAYDTRFPNRVWISGGPFLGENKWQNGFYDKPSQTVFGIPLRYDGVLMIDTQTETTSIVTGVPTGTDKYESGCVGNDGAFYCCPLRGKQVMRIVPHGR